MHSASRRGRLRTRAVTVVTAVLVLAGLSPGVAWAAPPSNDDFDDATAISALPFTIDMDLSEATAAADDPQVCTTESLPTVWFDYTPVADGFLAVDLDETGYAHIAVFTGVRGALRVVPESCHVSWDTPDVLPVTAGTTYHVQVAIDWPEYPVRLTVEDVFPPSGDDFADAVPITTVPATIEARLAAATVEQGEPSPSCAPYGAGSPSAWFALTAPRTESVVLRQTSDDHEAKVAVYTGTSLTDLTEVMCGSWHAGVVPVAGGRTYWIQLVHHRPEALPTTFTLAEAPPLNVDMAWSSADPSILDSVTFTGQVWDEAGQPITRFDWDFGDGTTASGYEAGHRYVADGDYPVRLTATSADGRTGTSTRTVAVRTHDVRILSFTTPARGRPDQTRPIEVVIGNQLLPEDVVVTLYKSAPGGYQEVGRATQYVPAHPSRSVAFPFNYTFTPADAAVGRVAFRAVVTLAGGSRDARPVDNEAIAPATVVRSTANEVI
ncbi:PKD domain-containing protein [Saccharothrix lopnurensis]|uniref:PKD domain-containing protein n=1 Tax=Saccharothrix lopnurensis TaxID=1670621 RepID=A0ABW1P872_9PSEU